MSQLPARGDVMELLCPSGELFEVLVVAIDELSEVWVTKDTVTGELLLMKFDEELNWSNLIISTEDPA